MNLYFVLTLYCIFFVLFFFGLARFCIRIQYVGNIYADLVLRVAMELVFHCEKVVSVVRVDYMKTDHDSLGERFWVFYVSVFLKNGVINILFWKFSGDFGKMEKTETGKQFS